MAEDFIGFWRTMSTSDTPYVHPEDVPVLQSLRARHFTESPLDFDHFLSSNRFGDFGDRRFHLSLLPVPYLGDLARADIFLLLLNPGFDPADYYAEYRHAGFRERAVLTLRQEMDGIEYPFHCLDPDLCWHPGFGWWEGKLRGMATLLAEHRYRGRYDLALKELAQRVAAVELVPYHSRSYGGLPVERLPSAQAALRFARTTLAPRAARGEILVVVTRQIRTWGLPPSDGIVTYEGLERSASLGVESPGGKAIASRLLADVPWPNARAWQTAPGQHGMATL